MMAINHSNRYNKARAKELIKNKPIEDALELVEIFVRKCQVAKDIEALKACKDLYETLLADLMWDAFFGDE